MISNLIAIGASFLLAAGISRLHIVNGNPYHLTLRGRRVLFVVLFLIGLLINQIALHLYWTDNGYIWK